MHRANREREITTAKKTEGSNCPAELSEEQFHAISRALADPRRFSIFRDIAANAEGIACSALSEHGQISPATISHHLKELTDASLIEIRREGRSAHLLACRSAFDAYVKRLATL